MLCEECESAEATLHQILVKNDEIMHVQLCESCAEETDSAAATSSGEAISEMLSSVAENDGKTCEQCGMTLTEFRQSGRVGCSSCYFAFEEHLEKIIHRIHGADYHVVEEKPDTGLGTVSSDQKLQMLEKRLQKSIEAEEYEEAARLRDRIDELEDDVSP